MSEILPQQFCIVFMWTGKTWTNGQSLSVCQETRSIFEQRLTAGWYDTGEHLDQLDDAADRITAQVLVKNKDDRHRPRADRWPSRYVPCLDDGIRIFDFDEDRDTSNIPAMLQRRKAWDKAQKLGHRLDRVKAPSYVSELLPLLKVEDLEIKCPACRQREYEQEWKEFLEACREFWVIGALAPITKVRPFYFEEMRRRENRGPTHFPASFVIPDSLSGRQRKIIEWHLSTERSDYKRAPLLKAKELMLWDDVVPAEQRKTLEKKVKRAAARGVVSSAFARAWFQMHAAVAQIFKGPKPKTKQTKQPRRKQTA
jgi:hypothetical protein